MKDKPTTGASGDLDPSWVMDDIFADFLMLLEMLVCLFQVFRPLPSSGCIPPPTTSRKWLLTSA